MTSGSSGAWWEVPPETLVCPPAAANGASELEQLANGARWAPMIKGGESQPWFSPVLLVVDWERDGERLRNFKDTNGKVRSRPQNTDYYFRPGFSWTRRAARLIPYIVPAGCIPSVSRYQAFPKSDPYLAVGIAASDVATAFCRFYGDWFSRPNFLVDHLKALPVPDAEPALVEQLARAVRRGVETRRRLLAAVEPTREFYEPRQPDSDDSWDYGTLLGSDLESKMALSYGLTETQVDGLFADMREALSLRKPVISPDSSEELGEPQAAASRWFSYIFGVAMGRWAARPEWARHLDDSAGDPFAPMPGPPGMLADDNGMPVAQAPPGYPLMFRRLGFSSIRRARTGTSCPHWSGSQQRFGTETGVAAWMTFARPSVATFVSTHVGASSPTTCLSTRPTVDGRRSTAASVRLAPGESGSMPPHSLETLCMDVHAARQRERQGVEVVSSLQRERSLGGVGRSLREVDRELTAESTLMEELRVFRVEAERISELEWEPDLNDGTADWGSPCSSHASLAGGREAP